MCRFFSCLTFQVSQGSSFTNINTTDLALRCSLQCVRPLAQFTLTVEPPSWIASSPLLNSCRSRSHLLWRSQTSRFLQMLHFCPTSRWTWTVSGAMGVFVLYLEEIGAAIASMSFNMKILKALQNRNHARRSHCANNV